MKKRLLLILGLLALNQAWAQSEVRFGGALRNIMHGGDLSAQVAVDSVAQKSVYGLGAATGLQGEWVIWDGEAWRSRVENGRLLTEKTNSGTAALLVWSRMNTSIPGDTLLSFKTEAALQAAIIAFAQSVGVDTNEPFPFWLEGEAEIDWHVIDWLATDSVHTHEKHKTAGLHGKRKLKTARIIGFYSPKHAAIYTHHSTRLHMHLLDTDQPLAAHIDGISGKKLRLRIGADSHTSLED